MGILKHYADGLLVRTAEPGDVDGVTEIDAYGDLDPVRTMWPRYISHPDQHAFVAELEGKIIAFCYICLTDGGQVLFRGSKRIHQDYRGRGYLALFLGPVEEYLGERFPEATRWRYVALNNPYQTQQMVLYRNAGVLRDMFIHNWLMFTCSPVALEAQYGCGPQLSADYKLTELQLFPNIPECLLDPSVQAELSPEGRLSVIWGIYRPLVQRIDAEQKDAEKRGVAERDGEAKYAEVKDAEKRDVEENAGEKDAEKRDVAGRDVDENAKEKDAEEKDAEEKDEDEPDACYVTCLEGKVKAASFITDVLIQNESATVGVIRFLRRTAKIYVNHTLPMEEQQNLFKQHVANAILRPSHQDQAFDKVVMGFSFTKEFSVDELSSWVVDTFPGMVRWEPDWVEGLTEIIMCEYDKNK